MSNCTRAMADSVPWPCFVQENARKLPSSWVFPSAALKTCLDIALATVTWQRKDVAFFFVVVSSCFKTKDFIKDFIFQPYGLGWSSSKPCFAVFGMPHYIIRFRSWVNCYAAQTTCVSLSSFP